VDLTFADAELAALCSSQQLMTRRWGDDGYAKVGRRLLELSAVEASQIEHLPRAVLQRAVNGSVTVDFDEGDVIIEGVLLDGKGPSARADAARALRVTGVTVKSGSGAP
jgi:hypothetical protein